MECMRRVQFHLRSASQWNHPLQTSLNCRRSFCKDLHAQAEDFLRGGCLQAAFQLGNALGFEYLWGTGVSSWPVTSHHPPRPQAVEHVSHEGFGGRLSGLDDSWFRWFMYALRVAIPCLAFARLWLWCLVSPRMEASWVDGWVEELDGIGHWVDVDGWTVGGQEHVEYMHTHAWRQHLDFKEAMPIKQQSTSVNAPPHSKTAWAAFKKKSYPIFGYLWFVVALEAM